MRIKKYILLSFLFLGLTSCGNDYLDTVYNSGVSEDIANDMINDKPETLAESYLNGIYGFMASWDAADSDSDDDLNFMGILLVADMTGQDLTPTKSHWFIYDYQFDNRMNNYRRTLSSWKTLYTMINNANKVIDIFPEGPETEQAKGLVGQAYTIRAVAYYYLIQLYQKSNTADASIANLAAVPILYAGFEKKENKMGRNKISDVRSLIESDLTKAESLLAEYERPVKYYIDLSVVKGMQARYYLLVGEWDKAIVAAQSARTAYPIMSRVDDGFMKISNEEWIWGFDHNAETQTTYASFFSHISNIAPGYAGAGYCPKAIDAKLYNQISDKDIRKIWFKEDYLNYKFGDDGHWTMDFVYMRSAEMVLIEAEAQAHLGQGDKAASALKVLMEKRIPDWNETVATVSDVHLQRRIELWGEGFDFFDLKRLNIGVVRKYEATNHIIPIDVPAGDKAWVYQIPLAEIQENNQIAAEDNNP